MAAVSGGYPSASPDTMPAAPVADAGWREQERLTSVDGLQDLSVSLQRHAAHGTAVVLAKTGGPLCSVAMVFATEASDDKGLVHCLEHLCFMGSQRYRKGHLDLLCTRTGCEGANAYTDADHTCFELTAAGEVGLLAVLPVFVDHILCPTLADDAFVTEIHHVNGKGERQGVVFSEMLGRVTDQEDMLDLELRRATFGDESPYSHEHGGLPDMIMKLSREDIAGYHKEVYTTDNLHVVVSGAFEEAKLLDALAAALDGAVARGAQQRCVQRPFAKGLPSLPEACPRRREVKFPSDDVSVGTVAYSHRLPGVAVNDVFTNVALAVLGRFLTGDPSSPLEQAFVQCDPPIATGVSCGVTPRAEPHLTVQLEGVPFQASDAELQAAKKLGGEDEEDDDEDEEDDEEDEDGSDKEAEAEADEADVEADDDDEPDWFEGDVLLQRLVDKLRLAHGALLADSTGTIPEMVRAVKKEQVERRVSFEDEPEEFVKDSVLQSLIFAQYPSAKAGERVLQVFPQEVEALDALLIKSGGWWAELLETHLLQPLEGTLRGEGAGAAEIRACPSAVLCLKNERKEEKETKANAKKLGKAKLKTLQQRLDAAEEANKQGLSEEQRGSFPLPVTPDCVPDFAWSMVVREPPDGVMEVLEVEVPSAFVELHTSWQLDSEVLAARLGAELRPYLSLFAALVMETDVGGENYRSIAARLDDELVSHSASIGCGSEILQPGSNLCQFSMKFSAEPHRMCDLVTWMDRLVHTCEFPEERVLTICKRSITALKDAMRDAETVLSEVVRTAVHSPLSPQLRFGALSQRPFIESCLKDVKATCRILTQIRDIITSPTTPAMAVVSARTTEQRGLLTGQLQAAMRARHAARRPSMFQRVQWVARTTLPAAPLLPPRNLVVGCAGADTATVQLRAPLALPALALDARRAWALELLCESLSMMEGPLPSAVRGKGLAYGASVSFSSAENAVFLDLNECTNVKKAVEVALETIRAAVEDEDTLSAFQLDNARGSLVFGIKAKRSTPSKVTRAAVGSAVRGWRDVAEVSQWEAALGSVTRDDVVSAHQECLLKLCDPSSRLACVVCGPGDCKKTAKGFASALGIDAEKVFVKTNISDCFELVEGRIKASLAELAA